MPSNALHQKPGNSPSLDPAAIQPSLPHLPTHHHPDVPQAVRRRRSRLPLDLPNNLLPTISTACSTFAPGRLPSRSHCCPTLTAYSATAFAARPLPAPPSLDLPILPDDSEACVGGVKRTLRDHGVKRTLRDHGVRLPRVNGTCDAAYYYCSIHLRRLTCAGGAFSAEGRWVSLRDASRHLERDCSLPSLSGCSRCLSDRAGLVRGPKFLSSIWYGLMGHAWHGLVL